MAVRAEARVTPSEPRSSRGMGARSRCSGRQGGGRSTDEWARTKSAGSRSASSSPRPWRRGAPETWVSNPTGYKSSQMLNRYRRAARSAKELGLGWLVPMDRAIPELAELANCHSIAIVGGDGGPSNSRNSKKPDKAEVAEWQTRRTQNPFLERECGFKSHLRHHSKRFEFRHSKFRSASQQRQFRRSSSYEVGPALSILAART